MLKSFSICVATADLIFHYLAVKDEVRPTYQNRLVKSHDGTADAVHRARPSAEAAELVPLVNNRKGSCLLPSTLGSGEVGRAPASQLQRARSLPVKYRYRPSNSTCARRARRLPVAGCISQCVARRMLLQLECLHVHSFSLMTRYVSLSSLWKSIGCGAGGGVAFR